MQAERLWNLVEYRWGPPLILDAQGRSIRELKPKHKWDKVDNEGSEANDMAVFSIFNEVCLYEFCKIANYKHVKEFFKSLMKLRLL